MEASTFEKSDYADELARGASNRDVGTKLLFENDRCAGLGPRSRTG